MVLVIEAGRDHKYRLGKPDLCVVHRRRQVYGRDEHVLSDAGGLVAQGLSGIWVDHGLPSTAVRTFSAQFQDIVGHDIHERIPWSGRAEFQFLPIREAIDQRTIVGKRRSLEEYSKLRLWGHR